MSKSGPCCVGRRGAPPHGAASWRASGAPGECRGAALGAALRSPGVSQQRQPCQRPVLCPVKGLHHGEARAPICAPVHAPALLPWAWLRSVSPSSYLLPQAQRSPKCRRTGAAKTRYIGGIFRGLERPHAGDSLSGMCCCPSSAPSRRQDAILRVAGIDRCISLAPSPISCPSHIVELISPFSDVSFAKTAQNRMHSAHPKKKCPGPLPA